ncbi:MAG: hypothetical protein IT267_08475 [Saprospiraceae bacterium]|nr:hypothetical protein [Saprospiraceae bacterium]
MKKINVLLTFISTILFALSCTKEIEQSGLQTNALAGSGTESIQNPTDPSESPACYTYVFPIKVKIGNTEYTANNQAELDKLLGRGPTLSSRPLLVYPFDVIIVASRKQVTVNNPSELAAIQKECDRTRKPTTGGPVVHRLKCYKYVFPLQLALSDGSIKTVNSEEELNRLFRSTGSIRAGFRYVFPFKVLKSDGTEITVNNPQELARLDASCRRTRNQ